MGRNDERCFSQSAAREADAPYTDRVPSHGGCGDRGRDPRRHQHLRVTMIVGMQPVTFVGPYDQ